MFHFKRSSIFHDNLFVSSDLVFNGEFLQNMPDIVIGNFICINQKLTTLKGSPKYVYGDFMCYMNELTNLEGGPTYVSGIYNCSINKLTSLSGICLNQIRTLMCYDNQLSSLELVPQDIYLRQKLNCYANFNKHDLSEEIEFIESRVHRSKYWPYLYDFMILKNKDLTKIHCWPDEAISYAKEEHKNLMISSNTMNKFKI